MWKTDVDDRDLPALYGLATALVLPSFYEGFGLPVLEVMACGTVPVVSGNSSLPEIVGDVGALIDPYDAESITHALHRAVDPEWRRDQELAALRRADLRLLPLRIDRPRPVRASRRNVISRSTGEAGGSRSPPAAEGRRGNRR